MDNPYIKFLVMHNTTNLCIAEFEDHKQAWSHYTDIRTVEGTKWAEVLGIHRELGVIRLGYYVPSPGV